jgi:hypothetical protein
MHLSEEQFLKALENGPREKGSVEKKKYTLDELLDEMKPTDAVVSNDNVDVAYNEDSIESHIDVKYSYADTISMPENLPRIVATLVNEQSELYCQRHSVKAEDQHAVLEHFLQLFTKAQNTSDGELYKYRLFMEKMIQNHFEAASE